MPNTKRPHGVTESGMKTPYNTNKKSKSGNDGGKASSSTEAVQGNDVGGVGNVGSTGAASGGEIHNDTVNIKYYTKTSNTYKMYVDNSLFDSLGRTTPFVFNENGFVANQYARYRGSPVDNAIDVALPWKMMDNTNLYNYVRPVDFQKHVRDGATGFRIKSYNIKIKGMYQLLDYQLTTSANTQIQNQTPSYLRVAEVPTNIVPSPVGAPTNEVGQLAESFYTPNFGRQYQFGDCHSATAYGFSGVGSPITTNSNHLTQACTRVKCTINPKGITDTITDLKASAFKWFPDIDKRAKKITLLGQGEDYEWHWENKLNGYNALYDYVDGKFVYRTKNFAYYPSSTYGLTRNYAQLNDGGIGSYQKKPNRGDLMAQADQVPQLLFQVPDFPNATANMEQRISHKAYFYATFSAEIEWTYNKTGLQHMTDVAPTNMFTDNIGTTPATSFSFLPQTDPFSVQKIQEENLQPNNFPNINNPGDTYETNREWDQII